MQFGQTYIWERQVTLGAFWRLLLQGREPAARSNAVGMLTILSQATLAIALFIQWRQSRENENEDARESFLITAMTAMPLLLPYFLDYDLLLLAVPATLYARRFISNPPHLGSASWTALYVCLLINPGLGRLTHVNLAVPLLCVTVVAMLGKFAAKEIVKEEELGGINQFSRLAA